MDVCDEEIHKNIEYFRLYLFTELETEIKERNISDLKVDEIQLVVEPGLDSLTQSVVCYYYFVNPRTRSVFWLDECDRPEILKDCRGNLSLRHKGMLHAAGLVGLMK